MTKRCRIERLLYIVSCPKTHKKMASSHVLMHHRACHVVPLCTVGLAGALPHHYSQSRWASQADFDLAVRSGCSWMTKSMRRSLLVNIPQICHAEVPTLWTPKKRQLGKRGCPNVLGIPFPKNAPRVAAMPTRLAPLALAQHEGPGACDGARDGAYV